MPIWLMIVRIEIVTPMYIPIHHIMKMVKTELGDFESVDQLLAECRRQFPGHSIQVMYFARDPIPPGEKTK